MISEESTDGLTCSKLAAVDMSTPTRQTPQNYDPVAAPTMAAPVTERLEIPWIQAAMVSKWGDLVWNLLEAEERNQTASISKPHPVWFHRLTRKGQECSWDGHTHATRSHSTLPDEKSEGSLVAAELDYAPVRMSLARSERESVYNAGGLQKQDSLNTVEELCAELPKFKPRLDAGTQQFIRAMDAGNVIMHPTSRPRLVWDEKPSTGSGVPQRARSASADAALDRKSRARPDGSPADGVGLTQNLKSLVMEIPLLKHLV
jgi:hypothetical protein